MIDPITPAELKAWLEDESRESPVIIDVRENWEHALAQIPGSVHIPMQTIPARVGDLDSGASHVLLCHHGMRSHQVAQFLAREGFDRLHNLSGGIDAWASEVDPAVPRY